MRGPGFSGLLPLALAILMGLAGCASEAPSPAAPAPAVITDPTDYSYLANATPGSHVHDYWQGRHTVLVVEDSRQGQYSCSGGCTDMGVAFFRPDKDRIVPQGAAWVNVTVEWSETGSNSHGVPQLWVKTATDSESTKVADLVSGGIVSVRTTNERDDPPHYALSLWRFEVRMTPPAGSQDIQFQGEVKLRAVADRGLPLLVYGTHPDQWAGGTEVELIRFDGQVDWEYQVESPLGRMTSCNGGCLGELPVLDGKVVPFDAAEVQVVLTFASGAVPTGVGLFYHGGDTWDLQEAQPLAGDAPGTLHFKIPVGASYPDSPYAKQSLWEFQLALIEPTPVRAWEGGYHAEAKAVKAA